MKNQALFSSKDKSKKLKCRLLQFLFGALRVKHHFCLLLAKSKCISIFLTSGLVHPYHLDGSISSFRGFWWRFSLFVFYKKIPKANSADPNQILR